MFNSDIEESYPLTPLQEGMLFNHESAPGSGVDIVQIVCSLDERIDAVVLGEAWQSVLDRNRVIRTFFGWNGEGEALQSARRSITSRVAFKDLREKSAKECEKEIARHLEEERRTGFNLASPPLIRLTLFGLGAGRSSLVLTLHHMLLDGQSYPLLLAELFSSYAALRAGREFAHEERVQFRSYVEWLLTQDPAPAKPFWREYLGDFGDPTPLPPETGPVLSPGGLLSYGREERRLAPHVLSGLHDLARDSGTQLGTVFRAGWGLLLSRHSGRPDVVFGETRACRRSTVAGAEDILGCCINTVPLRIRIRPELPVGDWLGLLAREHDGVREHERTSLARIRMWSSVPGDRPLFQSILVYNLRSLSTVMRSRGDLVRGSEFSVLSHTNFPIVLEVDGEEGMVCVTFAKDRFSPPTIARLAGHFETILTAMAERRDLRVGGIPLLTSGEERLIIHRWNDTGVPGAPLQCVQTLIEDQAARTPEAVAVSCGDERLTYRELNRRAGILSRHLMSFGAGSGTVVGIGVDRSCAMLIGLLGILKSGAAYLPLDLSLPEERLLFMLDDAASQFVVTSRQHAPRFARCGAALVFHEDVCGVEKADDSPETSAPPGGAGLDDPAYVIYTSGSTGRPKGTVVLHRGLSNYLVWCTEAYGVREGRGSLVHTPLSFDLTVTGLFSPLLCGREVRLLQESMGPEDLAGALLERRDYSIVKITPAHLDLLSMLIPRGKAAGLARAFVIGGAALRGESLLRWQKESPGTALFNEYGPTETVVGCCVYRVPPGFHASGPVPIGRPIANTRLYILDRSMGPVPIGVTGELCIAGVGVASGYLNRPSLGGEKFIPDPFSNDAGGRMYRSGDLARYLPDGTIEFMGRADGQVKIRGYRIEPGEIESVMTEHDRVREAAVVVREASSGEGRIELYCVTDGDARVTRDELRAHARRFLPDYMVPAAFIQLRSMPLNDRGKVDRHALAGMRDPDEAGRAEAGHARTPLEESLARVWEEVLGVESVSPDDDFFERGGHSLLVMRLVSRVHARWNVDLRISEVFKAPTVSELAGAIERKLLEEVENMPEEDAAKTRKVDPHTAKETRNV